MTGEPSQSVRLPTHIAGLDEVLEGGFLRGAVYIVEGSPGAGKTTLGSHFCFNHAAAGGRAVYMTLLAESHTRLIGHLQRMKFFDARLVPSGVYFVSAFKVLEAEGLDAVLRTIRQTVKAQAASVLVLDGLLSAEESAPNAREFKKFIHELQTVISMSGCTALLLSSTERPGGFRPERTMVDGILEIEDAIEGRYGTRNLRVRKMRGANPLRGKHTFEISDAGVRIVPRMEARVPSVRRALAAEMVDRERLSTGVAWLDAMLGGGLLRNSVTAIAGPTGTGKTLFGLHFLHAGVTAGEPCVYFGFNESLTTLFARSRRFGLALEQARDAGRFEVAWQRPVEGILDVLADRLIEVVKRTGAKRLVIDGMRGFELAAGNPAEARDALAALSAELEALEVTTLYTVETLQLLTPPDEVPAPGMSAVTQNLFLLRYAEESGRITRKLAIIKVRDSEFDARVRPFTIADDGIRALDIGLIGRASVSPSQRPAPLRAAKTKKQARSRVSATRKPPKRRS